MTARASKKECVFLNLRCWFLTTGAATVAGIFEPQSLKEWTPELTVLLAN